MNTPRTKAGQALVEHIVELRTLRYGQNDQPIILAIEEQAATEADLRLLVMTTARDAAVVEADRLRANARREERAHGVTIDQRDAAEDAADRLAYAIAPVEVIGEHSNGNDPWQNAIEHLEGERQAATEARRELLATLRTEVTAAAQRTPHRGRDPMSLTNDNLPGVPDPASPRTAESRETGEGLPEGAMLSVMGPTATPDRRFVALIMDHPSEYTSRTLSVGFGDSMEAACVAARAELGDYDAKTWPYRNKTLDDAVELARLARFRSALPSPPPPDDERLRAIRIIRDAELALGFLERGETRNALMALRRGFQRAPVRLRAVLSDEPGETHEEPR